MEAAGVYGPSGSDFVKNLIDYANKPDVTLADLSFSMTYGQVLEEMAPAYNSGKWNLFLVEFWASMLFFLTYLVVTAKKSRNTEDSAVNGGVIAVALFACMSMMMNISGGCLNPATATAFNLQSWWSYNN